MCCSSLFSGLFLNFDFYQLYDVNPERTKNIKKNTQVKIISALTINERKDVKKYKDYLNISEIILFDRKGYEKSIGFDKSTSFGCIFLGGELNNLLIHENIIYYIILLSLINLIK